ncbi:MAG: hypothetical protein NTV86_13780 [Planctomycetota bacterium]|nr:hypothetical protein [Planctomycetota bacterium]
MVGMKHRYDDERLVELIVEKRHTHAQIAEMLGVSESLVKKISCGLRRPDLQRRMWDAENGLMSDARRLGARYARGLVSRQIELGLTGEGEAARRAREFVLRWAIVGRPRRGDLPSEWAQECDDLTGLGVLGNPERGAGEPEVNAECTSREPAVTGE